MVDFFQLTGSILETSHVQTFPSGTHKQEFKWNGEKNTGSCKHLDVREVILGLKIQRTSVTMHLFLLVLNWLTDAWVMSVSQHSRMLRNVSVEQIQPRKLPCLPTLHSASHFWWNIWWILALVTTGTNDITNSQYLIPSPLPFLNRQISASVFYALPLSLSLAPCLHSWLCASLFMWRVYSKFSECWAGNYLPPSKKSVWKPL